MLYEMCEWYLGNFAAKEGAKESGQADKNPIIIFLSEMVQILSVLVWQKLRNDRR